MEPITMALTAAAFGGKLLSGIGAQQSSAKQGRLQMMENERVRALNQERSERLGRELLDIEETNSVENNSWQHTSQWGDIDIDTFRADGERLGYNPVTWLQSGALSMYGRTEGLVTNGGAIVTTSRGHNAADAYKLMLSDASMAQATQIPNVPSTFSVFGDALSAGTSMLGTQWRADQSYDLNMQKLMTAQALQGMGLSQNSYGMSGGGGAYPQGFGGASAVVGGLSGGPRGGGKDTIWPYVAQPAPQLFENKTAEGTNPFPPQLGWKIPPGWQANAEAYEDSFSEVIAWPYGATKFANTVLYNLTGDTAEGWISNAWNRQPNGPVATWFRAPPAPNLTRYSGTPYSKGSMSP